MQYSFLIIDKNPEFVNEILALLEGFPKFFCAGTLDPEDNYLESIQKLKPQIIFVGLPFDKTNVLNFESIYELHQYAQTFPYFVGMAKDAKLAIDAIQAGFSDFLIAPHSSHNMGKCLFKFEKRNPVVAYTSVCIKSFSDYQFVELKDIIYLKADNNTTDIKLINGKKVNAYKTLKYFENSLPFYFYRIHNSYIVNVNYVSRMQVSKSKCYINYNEILPFSNTYKKNIDAILRRGNL